MEIKMDIFEFAAKLNGRQYGNEISKLEAQQAKDLGFVVVFGYSDDNTEFRGAYDDEVGCFDGGRVYVDGNHYIDALWCKNGIDWSYETNIPHATFEVYDGADLYCRGIVFEKHPDRSKDPIGSKQATPLVKDERSEEISAGFAEIVKVIRQGTAEEILNDMSEKLGEQPLESNVVIPTKQVFEHLAQIANKFGVWQEDESGTSQSGNKIDDTSEWIGRKFDFDDPYPTLIKSDYLICKNCGNYHFLRSPVYDKMRACTLFDIPLKVPKHCSECGKKMRNA